MTGGLRSRRAGRQPRMGQDTKAQGALALGHRATRKSTSPDGARFLVVSGGIPDAATAPRKTNTTNAAPGAEKRHLAPSGLAVICRALQPRAIAPWAFGPRPVRGYLDGRDKMDSSDGVSKTPHSSPREVYIQKGLGLSSGLPLQKRHQVGQFLRGKLFVEPGRHDRNAAGN